ncbi:pantoate kinase [Candidatus Nitrosocosmicus sp. R]
MVLVTEVPVAVAKAYSPGHITGFFSTPDSHISTIDPKFLGSMGAGFSIDKGITSTVKVFSSNEKNYEIKLNGIPNFELKVSNFVIASYMRVIREPVYLSIEHESDLPIGYGLGSSGSAALSLSYALNEALKTNLTKVQAAQIAHNADVVCRTGLGTVISEFTGGFEFRLSVGGPGIGRVIKSKLSTDWCVIVLCLEPIKTELWLDKWVTSENKHSLNLLGRKMVNVLHQDPKVESFLEMSYQFAHEYHLDKGKCQNPLNLMQAEGIQASVALFGHTLFTLTERDKVPRIVKLLEQFKGQLLVCGVDNLGARLVRRND